jgi:uncharacterized protein YecE (DUF72 family)
LWEQSAILFVAEQMLERSNPNCLVGCCGWGEAKAKYFSHFQVVELQTPFYEPPTVGLAAKWRALAPDSFQFCIKAWQLITHTSASPTYRRLKSRLSPSEQNLVGSFRPTEQVWLAWERTAEIARSVRAAVVLFQCPASFLPDRENIQNLRAFFSEVKREEFSLAWEPRGTWPADLVSELCRELGLVHCIDPFKTDPIAGQQQIYWRLHGRGGYRYRYSEEELSHLLTLLREHTQAASTPAYVLFNNIWMKDDALRFQFLSAPHSALS